MMSPGIKRMVVFCLAGLGAVCCGGGDETELSSQEVTRRYYQRTWQREHGLPPGDRVWVIRQTRDGYLWVGTQYGLARFDGRTFTVFDHVNTPELANDNCKSLAEDLEGNLWIGTGEYLVCKSGNSFRSYAAMLGRESRGFPPLCASRSGGVWVGGLNGVSLVRNNQVKHYPPDETQPLGTGIVTALVETESGNVWVGTANGLGCLNATTGTYQSCFRHTEFEGFPVFDLREDSSGGVWVHFMEYPPQPNRWHPTAWLGRLDGTAVPENLTIISRWQKPGSQGAYLASGPEGTLWFPGQTNGTMRRYQEGKIISMPIPLRLEEDFAIGAYVDRECNLWIGTSHSGLQCWTPRKCGSFKKTDGLPDNNVWTVCAARDGSVWVGTDDGMAQIQGDRCRLISRPNGPAHKQVRAVAEDLEGTIWVGTMRSLDRVQNGEITPVDLPGEWEEKKVRALLPGRDGSMWIGTVRGLTRIHKGERTKYTKAEGLGSDEVRAIVEDSAGAIWVGTLGGGLSRFRGGRFETFTTTNGLTSDNVWALHEDPEGVLWIGGDIGMDRLKDGKITHIGKAEGLPDLLVNLIISDDEGHLWVGHDRGIYALHRKELEELAQGRRSRILALEFGEADGLPSAETNGQKSYPAACKTRDGRIWFPTTGGVAIINPAKLGVLEVPPLSVIEEVRANGRTILANAPERRDLAGTNEGTARRGLLALPGESPARVVNMELPPGSGRVVEFHYTANTFVAPDKAKFKYRLRGLEESWIDAGTRRQAYFTNLRPGDYRFELLACNHQGLWQSRPAVLEFHLQPYYYQTWWFYTACGIWMAVFTGAFIGWRVRESRKITALERVNALNEQRRRIARDIHDELGASLTHIMRLSEKARKNSDFRDEVSQPTERIASIAGEAVDNIGEIVWANNPEYDTLDDLVAYLREHSAAYFEDTNIAVRFDFPETVPACGVTGLFRRHVVMVVKEALQNVIKHAHASEVKLRLSASNGRLELAITDNGRGLPGNGTRRFGNGLTNMRQRVEELKGTLQINSRPGEGTEIRFAIPLNGL